MLDPPKQKMNAVRRIMNNEERKRASSVAPSASPAPATQANASSNNSNKPTCRNCKSTDIENGICQDCGLVISENDIVAEIMFGESSNGAAIVQGSFVGAGQGGVRPSGAGLSFRRVPGEGLKEAREQAEREARNLMNQMVYQLHVPQEIAETALDIYKQAVNTNFTRGRKKPNVASVCMYTACRIKNQHQIMLIDLADIVKVDVFLLGRNYKELLRRLPHFSHGYNPVTIEDLIWRFASKLEFLSDTKLIAYAAIRIARRMIKDNISIGRRPAGVSGAALIMAARAHNYRRTVREVVYIAKVTMATLQERMAEFAVLPAANLTIKDFLSESENLQPAASHDPPSVYKQTKEWLEQHPKRAKKRKAASDNTADVHDSDEQNPSKRQTTSSDDEEPQESDEQHPSKRQRTCSDAETQAPGAEASFAPNVDKDGFVIPPTPNGQPKDQTKQKPKDLLTAHEKSLLLGGLGTLDDGMEVEALAREFAEDEEVIEEYDATSEMAMARQQGIELPLPVKIKPREPPAAVANDTPASDEHTKEGSQKKDKQPKPQLVIDEAWLADEESLEDEVENIMNDPANAKVVKDVLRETQQLAQEVGIQLPEETSAAEDPVEEAPAEEITGIEGPVERASAVGASQPSEAPSNGPLAEETSATSSTAATPSPLSVALDPLLDPIVREDEFADDPEVMYCQLSEEDREIKTRIWFNQNKDYLRKQQQKLFEQKMAKNKPKKKSSGKKARIGEGQAGPADTPEEATANMLQARALAVSRKIDYGAMGNLFTINPDAPGSAGTQSGIASAAGSDDGEGGDDAEMTDVPDQAAPSAPTAAAKDDAVADADMEEDQEGDYHQEEGDYHHTEEDYGQEYAEQPDYDEEEGGGGYNPW
ncbi:putative transcription factor IIIB 90 kDa subunit [Triangularia verruculosa]|uniref:Transcription factor IIIB 90 kDa subunit n=1 Tax=Triangularia verruculosa TaxID=2587418 RepID=A0AAN6X769_9PEZI|nr:putative transcription factor IIIB 90 kDa subunit [Triangularia verruculosa]